MITCIISSWNTQSWWTLSPCHQHLPGRFAWSLFSALLMRSRGNSWKNQLLSHSNAPHASLRPNNRETNTDREIGNKITGRPTGLQYSAKRNEGSFVGICLLLFARQEVRGLNSFSFSLYRHSRHRDFLCLPWFGMHMAREVSMFWFFFFFFIFFLSLSTLLRWSTAGPGNAYKTEPSARLTTFQI